MSQSMDFCKLGISVIENEAQAVAQLATRINQSFTDACQLLLQCQGRVVVTGMGKSGHIANKIAATLASTGTPAFFMHPGEASHGDLGMITASDIVIALSYSGFTQEILVLLPLFKRLQLPVIALTGDINSPLAKACTIHLDVHITKEACPLGLAPTTSTTTALVMGDALAIALLQAREFSAKDFALSHPGGALGRRLLLTIDDLCHKEQELPCVLEDTLLKDVLIEVTQKKLGMTCVVDKAGFLTGVFTDGDIRRTLTKRYDLHTTTVASVMTKHCKTGTPHMLAADALALMQRHNISALVIVNANHKPIGVVHLHDLLKAGVL